MASLTKESKSFLYARTNLLLFLAWFLNSKALNLKAHGIGAEDNVSIALSKLAFLTRITLC
jgi:hypothetical protein